MMYPAAISTRPSGNSWSNAVTEDALDPTVQKIQEFITSGHGFIGLGLGLGACKICELLSSEVLQLLGFEMSTNTPGPGKRLGLGCMILLMPLVCVLGPIYNENFFRGVLQEEVLKDKLKRFYLDLNFSDASANTAARVTSVFFTSVIFGVAAIVDAFMYGSNPVHLVAYTTILGLMLGLAKEASGALYMPIGMHISSNTLLWAECVKEAL